MDSSYSSILFCPSENIDPIKAESSALGHQHLSDLKLSTITNIMDRVTDMKDMQCNHNSNNESQYPEMMPNVRPWDSTSESGSECSSSIRLDNSVRDDASSATPSAMSALCLPFVKQLAPLPQFPTLLHYNMTLRIDKKIKAATVRTPFGPIINMRRKQPQSFRERQSSYFTSIEQRCGSTDSFPIRHRNNGPYIQNGQGQQHLSREEEEEDTHSRTQLTASTTASSEPENYKNCFFEVRSSLTAGIGAFALQNMHRGQTILVERALFHADNISLYDEIDKLTPSLKQAFDRMHAHNTSSCLDNGPDRTAIFLTNSFITHYGHRGVFLVASRFNHACRPVNNVAYIYDRRQDSIVFSAAQDVDAGEELFIDYGKDPANLYKEYGFVCRCGGCTSLTDDEVAKLENPVGS